MKKKGESTGRETGEHEKRGVYLRTNRRGKATGETGKGRKLHQTRDPTP